MKTNKLKYILIPTLLLIAAICFGKQCAQAQSLPATNKGDFTDFAASLETVRQTLKIPGMSVAVVQDQEILFAQGFGYADLENQVPATPETPYGLASVTKPIAAVIIMQLVEQGLVDLDTPVFQYGVNLFGKNVTVRHLLTHTSEGLPGTKHDYNGSRFGTLSGVIEFCHQQDLCRKPERTRIAPSGNAIHGIEPDQLLGWFEPYRVERFATRPRLGR